MDARISNSKGMKTITGEIEKSKTAIQLAEQNALQWSAEVSTLDAERRLAQIELYNSNCPEASARSMELSKQMNLLQDKIQGAQASKEATLIELSNQLSRREDLIKKNSGLQS